MPAANVSETQDEKFAAENALHRDDWTSISATYR